MKKIKKYLPIRIFSIQFGYGWWWGKYFFFIGKHSTAFAIVPMCTHSHKCTYKNGKGINFGGVLSWDDERQMEMRKDKEMVQYDRN